MSSSENFKYNENVSFIKEIFSSKIKFSPPRPSYSIVSQMKGSSSSLKKLILKYCFQCLSKNIIFPIG